VKILALLAFILTNFCPEAPRTHYQTFHVMPGHDPPL